MRVKMVTLYAGPLGVFHPNQTPDLPMDEAVALVSGGYAMAIETPVKASAAYEAPALPPYETAIVKRKPGRPTK